MNPTRTNDRSSRTRGRSEAELSAVAAPDGTQLFFTRTGPEGWPADFLETGEAFPK